MDSLDSSLAISRGFEDLAWTRIKAELSLAEYMLKKDGPKAKLAPAIDKARAIAAKAAENGAPRESLAAFEAALKPFAAIAKGYTVRLAGHAHIDMNWMWSWPETNSIVCDTFTTVLDLLDEFPQFRFTQSQASVYEIVEKNRPDLLARIAAYVREGRWEVAASHWVEGDKNMVGGESLCRHLLYTGRYLRGLFGDALPAEGVVIDWEPDTFGHTLFEPSYLAKGGIKYLYLHRPGNWRQPIPEAFWWEGPDGARVLVRNDMRRGYNCAIEPWTIISAAQAMRDDVGLKDSMVVYGVGDHGGGPTRRDLRYGLEMQSWPIFPKIVFDTARSFYGILESTGAKLPVLRGELNPEFCGCYTTQSLIKRDVRIGEHRLKDAELASAFAAMAADGAPYPRERFEEAWRKILFLHFHDILPGSCVHDSRYYAHGIFQEAMACTVTAETQALRALAGLVDTASIPAAKDAATVEVPPNLETSGQGAGAGIMASDGRLSTASGHDAASPLRPFVVFNPSFAARSEAVEFTIWDNEPWGSFPLRLHDKSFEAVMPDGSVRALQVVSKGCDWGHNNIRAILPLDVAGFGYSSVTIRESVPGSGAKDSLPASGAAHTLRIRHACSYSDVDRNEIGLENGLVRAVFDKRTGRIVSLFDKKAKVEMIDAKSAGIGLEYSVERPHPMSAWLIENAGAVEYPAPKSVKELRNGPYSAALEIVYTAAESSFTAIYELLADEAAIRVRILADWMQRGSPEKGTPNLRLAVPLALEGAVPTYEVAFGSIRREGLRPDEEVPALRWAHVGGMVAGRDAGCLILNDCKHGHALEGATMRVNLLRSAYEPDYNPEIGRHVMSFRIAIDSRECDTAKCIAEAEAFNRPLKPVGTGVHGGVFKPAAQLLEVEGAGVAVLGVKRAEDDAGLVVRVVETAGKAAKARIALDPAVGAIASAVLVDPGEKPAKGPAPKVAKGVASLALKPFEVAAVKLALA